MTSWKHSQMLSSDTSPQAPRNRMGSGDTTQLSASLFAADPLNLAAEIAAVSSHVESFHLDIMDGIFTPDFGLNARVVKELAAVTRVPLDVHLMVRDPLKAAIRYAELGVRSIAVHIEAQRDFGELASVIRHNGARVIAALRHTTAVVELDAVGDMADGCLLLTAPAGGGEFDPGAFDRLASRPRGLPTSVDGRIEPCHFARMRELGVDLVVVGATLFSAKQVGQRAAELSAMLSGAGPGGGA